MLHTKQMTRHNQTNMKQSDTQQCYMQNKTLGIQAELIKALLKTGQINSTFKQNKLNIQAKELIPLLDA